MTTPEAPRETLTANIGSLSLTLSLSFFSLSQSEATSPLMHLRRYLRSRCVRRHRSGQRRLGYWLRPCRRCSCSRRRMCSCSRRRIDGLHVRTAYYMASCERWITLLPCAAPAPRPRTPKSGRRIRRIVYRNRNRRARRG